MELTDLPMFGLIRNRMNWLGQRQQVLSQNVANADTPSYRARDLKEFDFREVLDSSRRRQMGVTLDRTNIAHSLGTSSSGRSEFSSGEVRDAYETAPDGNAVVLEEQMIKMSESVTNHGLMTQIYKKQLAMFKMVTRGGGAR